MNKEIFENTYWNYFLEIEEDFKKIERTIPVDRHNFETFSIQYMKLLFTICSEIDILLKEFITYNNWSNNIGDLKNINDYRKIITTNLKNFSKETICFSNDIEMKPFENWENKINPYWWTDNNDLKHNRTISENFKKSNQKNVLNAISALYQIEMYFYKSILDKTNFKGQLRMPVPQPKKYRIKNWVDNVELLDNRYILFVEDGYLKLEGI